MTYAEHIAKSKEEIEVRITLALQEAMDRLLDNTEEPRAKGFGPVEDGHGFVMNFRDGLGYSVRWDLHHEPAPFAQGQQVVRVTDLGPGQRKDDAPTYIVDRTTQGPQGEWICWLRPEFGTPETEFGVGAQFLVEAA